MVDVGQSKTRWRSRDVGVVLIIVALSGAAIVPAIDAAREDARRRRCLENLRQIGLALHGYHDVHRRLPPAAVWRQGGLRSSMLMQTKRIDRTTYENWARLLLPHLGHHRLEHEFEAGAPVLLPSNEEARVTRLPEFSCASDIFNRDDNRYSFQPLAGRAAVAEAARGNYAINGGTHNPRYTADNAAQPHGDALSLEYGPGVFKWIGNGVAGINHASAIKDFTNGQSTLVAIDEIRAGVHPVDPRGVWALGQIGGSITWAHGISGDDGGPNNSSERADDVLGCAQLHRRLGSERLCQLAMPCVPYIDRNEQATARSMHVEGVHCLFLGGAARFIANGVDRGLWHVMHSRETPSAVLEDLDAALVADAELAGEENRPLKAEGGRQKAEKEGNPPPNPKPEIANPKWVSRPHPGPGYPLAGAEGEGEKQQKEEGGRRKAERDSNPPPNPKSNAGAPGKNPESARSLAEWKGEEAEPGETLENSLGMRFVAIPAGMFTMGIPDVGNDGAVPPECPPHEVEISAAFWMGLHEVTQRQYQSVMGKNPSQHSPEAADTQSTDDFPVENVTWHEAKEFCRKLGEAPEEHAAGRRYRLPTEAEWEYACRSGKSEPYRWLANRRADDKSGEAAGISPPLPLAEVGSYPPNAFGLYDMRGNVWEWCADWFDRSYYSRSPQIDPQGPAKGYLKVVRGGDWIFVGEVCHINYPIMPPWKRSPFVGFRVVCACMK